MIRKKKLDLKNILGTILIILGCVIVVVGALTQKLVKEAPYSEQDMISVDFS